MPKSKDSYHHEPRCRLCSLEDQYGVPLRDEFDALLAKGTTYRELATYVKETYNLVLAQNSIWKHVRNHSPWIRRARNVASLAQKKMIKQTQIEHREAADELQKIVDVGGQMIDNWLEGKSGPKIPVTDKLFMEAIREQNRMKQQSTLDEILADLDKKVIEGELVDDQKEPKKLAPVAS